MLWVIQGERKSGTLNCMTTAIELDVDAIAAVCLRYGVERLRVFGSVLTDRFDPAAAISTSS